MLVPLVRPTCVHWLSLRLSMRRFPCFEANCRYVDFSTISPCVHISISLHFVFSQRNYISFFLLGHPDQPTFLETKVFSFLLFHESSALVDPLIFNVFCNVSKVLFFCFRRGPNASGKMVMELKVRQCDSIGRMQCVGKPTLMRLACSEWSVEG